MELGVGEQGRARATVRMLRDVAALASAARNRALEPHDLDEGRFDVLEALEVAGAPHRLTAGDLARRCAVTRGAISQRLATMERAGLVQRVRESPDRRTVHVQLSETGRARLGEAAADVAAAEQRLVDAVPTAERQRLDQLLNAWRTRLDVAASDDVD